MEVVSGAADPSSGETGTMYYLVRKVAAVTGSDLRSASVGLDENSRPAVMFSLKPDGARKFGQVTGSNIGRSLAIVLDDRVQSYPRIDGRITSEGRISGSFTQQEAADLALKLRSGALPASMTYLEERLIGPTLGADSIRSGVTAALAGLRARRHLHARLLQALGHQRHRRDGHQPDHPARDDGLRGRDDDAARASPASS